MTDAPPTEHRLDPLPKDPVTGFEFGRALGLSLSAWSCNVLPFTAITALVYSPILIYAFLALNGPFDLKRIENVDHWLWLGPLFLEPIVSGLIARAVLRQYHGKPTGVLEGIREAARQLVPLLGVTLLVGIFVTLGTIAIIVPGLLLYFAYFVAGPVAAIERPGVWGALSRSNALTSGHRLKMFGLVLLVVFITYMANQALFSYAKTSTTIEDVKLYIAIYYLIAINMVTLRAVIRAASYVELTGGAEPPAKNA